MLERVKLFSMGFLSVTGPFGGLFLLLEYLQLLAIWQRVLGPLVLLILGCVYGIVLVRNPNMVLHEKREVI